MKREEISEILNNIDTKYIEEAEDYAEKASVESGASTAVKAPRFRFRWAFAAAALVILIVAGSAFFAIRAEAREYTEAIEFFKSNGLSTEGLNRAEIKAVYRDITTKSFTYGKTAEVITNSIPGYAVDIESLSPEDLAVIWEQNTSHESADIYGCSYRIDYRYQNAEIHTDVTGSIVSCVKDGKELWSTVFPNFYIDQCKTTENGTLVLGSPVLDYITVTDIILYIALLDSKGSIKWDYKAAHGFFSEDGVGVFPKADGSTAVFISGYDEKENQRHLCFLKLDPDGNECDYKDILHGEYNFSSAARLGDDYLVQISEWRSTETDAGARLLRLDSNGNRLGEYSYASDNCKYYIHDMLEFGGQLYISAYAVPLKEAGSEHTYLEFDELHKYIEETYGYTWDSPEAPDTDITEFIKRYSTAVLLLCDPAGASPQLFYSVKGASIDYGSLSISESNELEWTVKSIEYITFNPLSSFTLGIWTDNCKYVKYYYNTNGDLSRIIDTGEAAQLYK